MILIISLFLCKNLTGKWLLRNANVRLGYSLMKERCSPYIVQRLELAVYWACLVPSTAEPIRTINNNTKCQKRLLGTSVSRASHPSSRLSFRIGTVTAPT